MRECVRHIVASLFGVCAPHCQYLPEATGRLCFSSDIWKKIVLWRIVFSRKSSHTTSSHVSIELLVLCTATAITTSEDRRLRNQSSLPETSSFKKTLVNSNKQQSSSAMCLIIFSFTSLGLVPSGNGVFTSKSA